MRKRIAKELPKVESDLRKELENFEDEYGRPFLVHGESYLDELTKVAAKPPPRSKTPSAAPSSATKRNAPPSRPGSVMRGPPPPRSSTKTPTGGQPTKYNTIGPSRSGAKSPTKIPGRVPLGNMPHGNNSPDRRGPGTYSSSTVNGKMSSSRAPPPRMRALTATDNKDERPGSSLFESPRCASALSNSFVRPVSPEDVYDDRQRSFMSSSIFSQRSTGFSQSSQSSHSSGSLKSSLQGHYPRPNPYLQHALPPPAPRQVSSTSTADTVTTGSENWETFDDASESDSETSDAYYAKLRAAHGKRLAPEDHHQPISLAGKKAKGIRSVSPDEPIGRHMVRVADSDNGWTDDMETY